MASGKKRWELTQAAFDKLLAELDADVERAAHQYEVIRNGVMRFFECRGGSSPADLADETINRVARKLLEGATILANSIAGYFYGVARNVLREDRRDPNAAVYPMDEELLPRYVAHDPEEMTSRQAAQRTEEERFDCLQHCVEQLPPETRRLIFAYYEGEEATKITNRKRLAEALRISMTALRLRVHRLRKDLEACVGTCCEQAAE
jgi:RNA polymerase sigma factor (sigma-70 family)